MNIRDICVIRGSHFRIPDQRPPFFVDSARSDCFGRIIVELGAVKAVADEHRAQVINYLKSTRMELGLLVNFGHYPKVELERFINQ